MKKLLVILLLIFISTNINAQTSISELFSHIYPIKVTPDTLEPAQSDTTDWLPLGDAAAFSVWGYYNIVSGDSMGGTIKYELDKWDGAKPLFTSHIPYWKMGQSDAITILTFTQNDTGYRYFDLHIPSSTAVSPCASIRFITTNTTQDTMYFEQRYLFKQP